MDKKNDLTVAIDAFIAQVNCIIGICDAAPLPHMAKRFTPFVSKDPHKRAYPTSILREAKSIIVMGVQSKIETSPPMPPGAGIVSALGASKDYHVIIRTLIGKLVTELQRHMHFSYKILVDSPTLDERALAVKAGLGYIGRSGLVISPEYGSRFNIGVLLTDIVVDAFPPRQVVLQECSPDCNNCISVCPSGALSETGGFNASSCISYLTQKDDLSVEEAILIGRHLYGCDICQDSCPSNHYQSPAWAMPEDWLTMTDGQFNEIYGHTAMLWRGPELLKRNAKAVIANVSRKRGVV